MSQASYVLSKIIPDMERGFTIQTNFGEHQVTAEDAGRYIQLLKMQLQQKLNGDQAAEPATPNQFAKLYNTPKGQILVMLDVEKDGDRPQVSFSVQPDHLGICSVAVTFEENEAGWKDAETYFGSVDETMAINKTDDLFKLLKDMGAE